MTTRAVKGHRDARPLFRAVKKAGGTVAHTRGQHIVVTFRGDRHYMASTPGDPYRSAMHLRTWLRKKGLDV